MCSATSMWLSPNGCDGSTRGSGAEDARRCTGWDASRSGTPISSSCGNSVCDRRLEGRSRMTRESHVRFSEGGGVRSPSATRLVVLIHAHKRHDWLIGAVNTQRRPLFELGRVIRPHHSAQTAEIAEVETQKPEALAPFQVDYAALFIIDFDLQLGELLP